MTTTIDLPDSHHAVFLDADEITNRQLKEIRRAARKVGVAVQVLRDAGFEDNTVTDDDAPEPTEAEVKERNDKALAAFSHLDDEQDNDLDLFQRTCAAVRLVEWSLDLPLPKTPDDVDNLPRGLYEALTADAAKLDLNESFTKEADLAAPKAEVTEEPAPTSDSSD